MPDWMDTNDAVLDLFLRLLLIDRANNEHLFGCSQPLQVGNTEPKLSARAECTQPSSIYPSTLW